MALDDARLAALKATKLDALVTMVAGGPCDHQVQPGLSLVCGMVGDHLFALADRLADLGPILAWAHGRDPARLTVFADGDAARSGSPGAGPADRDVPGHLARRASLLTADITVLTVVGASAVPTEAAALKDPPELGEELWRAATVMADAGARVVDDHGRLTGEILGLEVARVEPSLVPGDPPGVRVGVGEADRELQGYVHGHLDDVERLKRAVQTVARYRRPGVALHPLNRLSRPRWIRSSLITDPGTIGVADLQPQPPLHPQPGIFDTEPSAAYSASDRVTVVCSAGFDLDLLTQAVDYRHRVDPGSRLVLVLPERDVAVMERRVAGLADDLSVRGIAAPWG